MSKLLLATANRKKLTELQRIMDTAVGTARVQLVGLGDFQDYPDVPETGGGVGVGDGDGFAVVLTVA